MAPMFRTYLKKFSITIVCGAGIPAVGVPIGLYILGLSNVEGRPEPPTETDHIVADTDLLQQTFRSQAPVVVHALNRWTYTANLLGENPKNLHIDNGEHAVWLIASNYNSKHQPVAAFSTCSASSLAIQASALFSAAGF